MWWGVVRICAVSDGGGRLVRSVKEVKGGDPLNLRLHDGAIDARVTAVREQTAGPDGNSGGGGDGDGGDKND